MLLNYDFHLHSCLSPCGDADMTPYNIVRMAELLELDIIALTDHNSAGNCRSAMEAGANAGITVVPGMELCTAEEIHVVCLFPDIESAEAFGGYIYEKIPPVKNKPQIFGRQIYMDALDGEKRDEEKLLITAADVPISDVPGLVRSYGGFCYPAHIDRPAFSILSNLGDINAGMGFTCAEITPNGDLSEFIAKYPELGSMRIMRSSDAHYLGDMHEARDTIELPENSLNALMCHLKSYKNARF